MRQSLALSLIAALTAASGGAAASGFQLQNQSGAGNGNAFAGAAAAAEDASTVFFNPAGMALLPRGHNISLSATALNRSIHFDDKGSTTTLGGMFPLASGDGGNGGGISYLPHGYWAWGVDDRFSVGVGVGPTFGNKTEYDDDFTGRNAGFFFEMKQYNINPSLAFKLNETLSLGAGINFAYNESRFKQGVPLVMPAMGYPAGNHLDVKGSDWALGYNLGLMLQLTPATRLGLAYRSQLDFKLEGRERWAQPTAAGVDQPIRASIKTPANLSLALSQSVGERWEILGDLTWTEWSVIDTIQVKNKNSGQALQQIPYRFRDTWRIGVGANYRYSDTLKLRFGVAHDKTPVRAPSDRTMTLPDADRTWLSVGAKYQLSGTTSLDVGYTHIFFDTVDTARQVSTGYPGPETVRQTVRGEFKTSVDILSLQLNVHF